jgi:hypothetical protein
VQVGHCLMRTAAVITQEQALAELAARARVCVHAHFRVRRSSIAVAAHQGEISIREAVQELKVWGAETEFSFVEYKTTTGQTAYLVTGEGIGWHSLSRQRRTLHAQPGRTCSPRSAISSRCWPRSRRAPTTHPSPTWPARHVADRSQQLAPNALRAVQFDAKLAVVDECLHLLNTIQRKWVYLEPIFGRGALPQETARFGSVDREFREVTNDMHATPNVLRIGSIGGLKVRWSAASTTTQTPPAPRRTP